MGHINEKRFSDTLLMWIKEFAEADRVLPSLDLFLIIAIGLSPNMFNSLIPYRFSALLRYRWTQLQFHLAKKLYLKTDPARCLLYCVTALQRVPALSMKLSQANQLVIVAPLPADDFTELLFKASDCLERDINLKKSVDFGIFKPMSGRAYLTTRDNTILVNAKDHLWVQLLIIEKIAHFIEHDQSDSPQEYARLNYRILTNQLNGFQAFLESLLPLVQLRTS